MRRRLGLSRWLHPLALLALLLLPLTARADEADESEEEASIVWQTAYAAACKQAAADKKPLLFAFHSGWCPHCTRMEKTTWTDAQLASLTRSFVTAKINSDVEKVPVKRYSLVGYPTVIVAEPGGEEVLRLEGYSDANKVRTVLTAYLKHADAVAAAHAALRADASDPSARLRLGDFYSAVGLHAQAAAQYGKAAKGATGDVLLSASAGQGAALVKLKDFKGALKVLRPAATASGDAAPPSLLLALARAEAGQGDATAARQWFDRLLAAHPGSLEAEAARKELATL